MGFLKKHGYGLGMAALCIFAAVLFWYSTPHGLSLVNDTVQYIDGARNILNGHGYGRLNGWGGTTAITNFPPLYSIVLAVFIGLGLPPIRAAWWISLVFLCLNVILVGTLGRKLAKSDHAGLLAAFLTLISDPFFRHHLFGLSEPLFLFCFFMTLLFLAPSSRRHENRAILLAGVFAGLTYLTRYIGITLLAAGLVFLFFFTNNLKKGFKRAGLFLGGSAPFILGWTVRNMIVTGNPVNRQLHLRTLPPDKIQEGVSSFWGWLLPEPFHIIDRFINIWGILLAIFLTVYILAAIVSLLAILNKKERRLDPSCQLGWLVCLEGVVYLTVLVITILFIDASVNFETRILMPVFNLLLLLFTAGIVWLWRRGKGLKVLAVFLVMAVSVSFSEDTVDTVREWRLHGQGFANESWVESATIETVKRLPEVIIYTNRPQAINLFTGRGSYILLSPINPATQLPREQYASEREEIRQSVLDGKTVLVIFSYQDLIQESENSWVLDLTAGLPVLNQYEADTIFGNVPLIQSK